MRLLDLLKKIEWEGYADEGASGCPYCFEYGYSEKPGTHKPDCELKAAIDHFQRVSETPEAERTLEQVRYG